MQWSVSRGVRVGEHLRAAVVEQHDVKLLGTVARASCRSRCVLYGFMRSPVAERGSSWRKTSRSCSVGTIFSMPTSVISIRGSVRHIRPLPSDSTTQTPPVSAIEEVGAAESDRHAEELLAQELPRRRRQVLRLAAERLELHAAQEDLADLGAVAVQRRHHDVRRAIVAELDDEIGEVGLVGRDPGRLERDVQPRLVGRHRLDLDDLRSPRALIRSTMMRLASSASRGPVHVPAGARAVLLELLQIGVEMAEDVRLDLPSGFAQLPASRTSRRRPARACRG